MKWWTTRRTRRRRLQRRRPRSGDGGAARRRRRRVDVPRRVEAPAEIGGGPSRAAPAASPGEPRAACPVSYADFPPEPIHHLNRIGPVPARNLKPVWYSGRESGSDGTLRRPRPPGESVLSQTRSLQRVRQRVRSGELPSQAGWQHGKLEIRSLESLDFQACRGYFTARLRQGLPHWYWDSKVRGLDSGS